MDTAPSASRGAQGRRGGSLHEAVVAAAPVEHAELVAPRMVAAALAGDLVAAIVDEEHRAALTPLLGEASAQVTWLDPGVFTQVPAFTVAQDVARLGRRARSAGTRALVVARHTGPFDDPSRFPRLEAALNVVTGDLPVDVLCLHRTGSPDLGYARATHPTLTDRSGTSESAEYEPPDRVLRRYPQPPPPDLGPPDVELRFTAADLGEVREVVERAATDVGLGAGAVEDVVLAVSELATNAVEHGIGDGRLRTWPVRGERLSVEVVDELGGMERPFPGLLLPPPDGVRGRGLWLAAELCDALEVWAEDRRTTVRVVKRVS